MTEPMDVSSNPRRTLFIAVITAMIAGILLSTVYISLATSRLAQSETLKLGDSLSVQSEALIRPLILSNDRVSLNYLLNELIQTDHISGLQVKDRNGVIIARAGDVSDIKQVRRLLQQDKSIGSFTLWLNQAPATKLLKSQHIPLLLLACLSGVLILLAIWYTTRSSLSSVVQPDETAPAEEDFSVTLARENAVRAYAESPQREIEEAQPEASTDTSTVEPQDISPEVNQPLEPDSQNSNYQTDELVDLLKPEPTSTPQMPKFEHQPQDLDTATPTASEAPLVFEEQNLELLNTQAPESPKTENPLFKIQEQQEKDEQQLELYSFEHELELILPPQDAIYLFYLDTHTASSENISSSEKSALVNVYYHLAKQVARIYHGETEQLENNDILLRFELRDDKDSHGINALCAAMLFNLLYKGFNQSRIKGFQPVLSLQMSIARGHHSRYNLVQEEAHFLTRTTHSNELISHTALSEAPVIKQTLLDNSDIRREDEDKVLIMKLTAKHQTLLQKQANHLLTKIFKK